MCSRWSELVKNQRKILVSFSPYLLQMLEMFKQKLGEHLLEVLLKKVIGGILRFLSAWRVQKSIFQSWSGLLALILNRCAGLEGQSLDPWCHVLHYGSGNSRTDLTQILMGKTIFHLGKSKIIIIMIIIGQKKNWAILYLEPKALKGTRRTSYQSC